MNAMNTRESANVLRLRRLPRRVKVIAVTGGKGGVGKTNVCTNLAVSLALESRRVMLLDADFGLANAGILLGLRSDATLRDVVNGSRRLEETIVEGPAGVALVPGSAGFSDMANLSPAQHAGIIQCFSEVERDLDVLCIDTGPGIGDGVTRFAGAAQHVVVVVCDEPTSLADAYAIIKVLNREQGIDRFQVVTNMTRRGTGTHLFAKLCRVTERFLPVVLHHAGSIPFDERVPRSVRRHEPFVTAFPRSLAALGMRKLARRVDALDAPETAHGGVEFFVERFFAGNRPEEAALSS